jgi:hypothetical protein
MRDYDPTTGRYLQADPLGLVDGASVYGYVRQSPGRWTDARGQLTDELTDFVNGFWSFFRGVIRCAQLCLEDEDRAKKVDRAIIEYIKNTELRECVNAAIIEFARENPWYAGGRVAGGPSSTLGLTVTLGPGGTAVGLSLPALAVMGDMNHAIKEYGSVSIADILAAGIVGGSGPIDPRFVELANKIVCDCAEKLGVEF